MARVLVVGCGCRGRWLARAMIERGHAVRGSTRSAACAERIRSAGAEPVVADPDRVGTLARALDGVGVLCLLLGSSSGSAEALAALHGTRLEMLLTRVVDTTVRGVVYEGAGSVDPTVLRSGASRVREACDHSRIPWSVFTVDPADREQWLTAGLGAIDQVLAGRSLSVRR